MKLYLNVNKKPWNLQERGSFSFKRIQKKVSLFLNESKNSFIGEDMEQFALDPCSVKGTESHLSINRLKKGKYQNHV